MHIAPSRTTAAAFGGLLALGALLVASVVLWPDGDDGNAPIEDDVAASGDPPETFLIADLTADVDRYQEPGGSPDGVVEAIWHGRPSHLPVIDQRPGWLRVRLPQRPNGSTAWIRRDGIELTTTPYRIEVDVATTTLRLYRDGEVVLDAPAGVGTDEAPTATGAYFVTFLQEPPDTTPGWGPFVVVTSSHSETISDFQSSGDAIAAIHGPLGAEEEIGATGARVSFGCVRLQLDDLVQLREVPAGAPVDVIDSSRSGGEAERSG